jgi:hypothetical protein
MKQGVACGISTIQLKKSRFFFQVFSHEVGHMWFGKKRKMEEQYTKKAGLILTKH